MKIYPDNNILLYIESGKYELVQFMSVPKAQYYYSEIHMDELMNGLDNHPELKNVRLDTIEKLCGSKIITPDVAGYEMEMETMTPQKAFDLSMSVKFIHDQIYQFSKNIRIDRDIFLETIGMERIEVNNYKTSEIIPVLDEQLKKHWGYGIEVYLEKAVANTGRTVFVTLFNLLDFVCYWHDKDNAARLYDSSHAYFAKMCDVLVTNDKRMRIKNRSSVFVFGCGY